MMVFFEKDLKNLFLTLAFEEASGNRYKIRTCFPCSFSLLWHLETLLSPLGRRGGKQYGVCAREYSFKTLRGANKETVCIF
jgi:hypothetical protein